MRYGSISKSAGKHSISLFFLIILLNLLKECQIIYAALFKATLSKKLTFPSTGHSTKPCTLKRISFLSLSSAATLVLDVDRDCCAADLDLPLSSCLDRESLETDLELSPVILKLLVPDDSAADWDARFEDWELSVLAFFGGRPLRFLSGSACLFELCSMVTSF